MRTVLGSLLFLLLSVNARSEDQPPLRFAVIGEYGAEGLGSGTAESKVADLIKSWRPEFIITTGNNNLPAGEGETLDKNVGKYYRDYIYNYIGTYFPYSKPEYNRFFPALGTHDWDCKTCQKSKELKAYMNFFDLPGNKRYYSFRWGDADFFVLDSDPRDPDIAGGKDSKEAQWLKKNLALSDTLYRVVYFHHSPFSSGKNGDSPHMQWPFAQWGATVVIGGHDQNYERLMIDKIPYFVVGTGGAPLVPVLQKHKGSILRDSSGHGALLVEEEQKSLVFRYFQTDGKFIDLLRVKGQLLKKFKPRKTSTF